MSGKTVVRFIFSAAILFLIAVACVIFFYTCSLEYNSRPQPETEREQTVQSPELTAEEEPETADIEEPETEVPTEIADSGYSDTKSESEPVVEISAQQPEQEIETAAESEHPSEQEIETVTESEQPSETVETAETAETEKIPEAPDLDWFVYTELYEGRKDDWDSAILNDDVDWSQFVFSDEELVLPDGTYYAHLYVNNNAYGTVAFEQMNGVQFFSRGDLANELRGTLADYYYEEFFANGEAYFTIDYLRSMSEDVSYDSNNMLLKLKFNSSQVPVQSISMSTSSYSLLRQSYDVVGNVVIEPAKFSFETNVSAFASIQYNRDFILGGLSASMSFANIFSFWNITFNLPVSFSYFTTMGIVPSVGSWFGYIDFVSDSIRLSFGNVGNAGFTNGTPFGFTLEKNYNFGNTYAMSNQYSQTITLVEDSTIDIMVNGNSVFTKTLSLGVYRLTDFAFIQGSNNISVRIHPVSMGEDTTNDQLLNFSQNFDTSLMAKGESTWRFGAGIPKISQSKDSPNKYEFGFVTPALPHYSKLYGKTEMENIYNLSAIGVFWEQTVGITHTYTQTHSFSFIFEKNPEKSARAGEYSATAGISLSGIFATSTGTTRGTLNGVLSTGNTSRNSISLTLSQSFANDILKPMNLSGSYAITPDSHTVSLNTGYSMAIKSVRLGVTLNTSYKFKFSESSPDIDKPLLLSGALSVSTSFGKRSSFSVNASINQNLAFYATASLSLSLENQSLSSSVTTNNGSSYTGNVGWFYRPGGSGRNSFQINVSNINLANPSSHTLSASWARSGELMSFSLRQQSSANYTRFNTSLSLNTAFAYADGHLAMTNSIYSPFIIIAPESSLKKATISVSNANDSNTNASKKTFGNVLYTKLSMYKSNNIVVYASNGSLFTSSGSFLFKVTPYARQGFLAKIALKSSIVVSGVLRRSETSVYDSYSSPIYKVKIADNGVDVESIEIDDSAYFFTDVDGRYILSELAAGIYMIDLNINDRWYAAFFEVPEVEEAGQVALFNEFDASAVPTDTEVMQKYNVRDYDSSYAGSVYFSLDRYISEQEYWQMLFSLTETEEENSWLWDEEDVDTAQYQQLTNTAL